MNLSGSTLHVFLLPIISLAASVAHAESGVARDGGAPCSDGSLWPTGSEIPANLPSFLVRDTGIGANGPITLVRLDGTTEIPVDIDVRAVQAENGFAVVPRGQLVEGTHILRYDTCPLDGVALQRMIEVGPSISLPDAPGTITVDLLNLVTENRVFRQDVRVVVSVASADLEPWRFLLDYEVRLSGEFHSTSSGHTDGRVNTSYAPSPFDCSVGTRFLDVPVTATFSGYGVEPFLVIEDMVTLDCDQPTYVSGSYRPLTPEEVARIDMSPDASVPFDGGVAMAGPDAGLSVVSVDAGQQDDTGSTRDAGQQGDAGSTSDAARPSDAGSIDPDTTLSGPQRSRGCSVGPSGGSSWLALAMSTLALGIVGRRSARRSDARQMRSC